MSVEWRIVLVHFMLLEQNTTHWVFYKPQKFTKILTFLVVLEDRKSHKEAAASATVLHAEPQHTSQGTECQAHQLRSLLFPTKPLMPS